MFYDGCITIREDKKMNESFQKMAEIFETHTQEKGENDMNAQTATVDVTGNMDKKECASDQKATALKLMNGKYGGEFLVRYLYDIPTSMGWLELIMVYPTGEINKKLLKKNMPKKVLWKDSGVEAVGTGNDAFLPDIKHSRYNAPNGLFMEFSRPDFPIPFRTLWRKIVENYDKIPIVPIRAGWSVEDLYEELLDLGILNAEKNPALRNLEYVLLKREEITEVGTDFGLDFVTIRGEFASKGWWVVDKGSGGYQKSVKINGKKERYYALKRNRMARDIDTGLEKVETVEKTEYEEPDILKEESDKIIQIRRKEQEAERGQKKKGKNIPTIFDMI